MIVVSHLLFWTNVLVQLLACFLFFDNMMMSCFEISYKYQTNSLGLLISPVNKVPGR